MVCPGLPTIYVSEYSVLFVKILFIQKYWKAKSSPPPPKGRKVISDRELRGRVGWGWGMGGAPLHHITFCPNGGQDFSHSEQRKGCNRLHPLLPAQQKPVGRGFAAFFLSVSYGVQITNYSPRFSPNNQLVPESESPAQFGLSLKMQSRFSPTKAVQLLISGARLSKQSNTSVEL